MVSHLPHPSRNATESVRILIEFHHNLILYRHFDLSLVTTRSALREKAFALAEAPNPGSKERLEHSLTTEKQKQLSKELFKHLSLHKNHMRTLLKCRFLRALNPSDFDSVRLGVEIQESAC